MSRESMRRRLEAWGRQSGAGPSPEFTDRLETRLRAVGLDRPMTHAPRRRWGPRLVFAGAIAAVVIAMVLQRTPGPVGSLELASAHDAVVVLPDGSTRPATDGLVVAEGSEIRTGAGGRVIADGDVLGPNARAVIRDGRLVSRRDQARTAPTPSPARRSPVPTREPGVVPKPVPAATPKPQPEPTTKPVPGSLTLECKGGNDGARSFIACHWSATKLERFASYRLWRNDGEHAAVVFRTKNRDQTGYTDVEVRAGHVYGYKVEALDAGGSVIASGGPVRAEAPASRKR